MNVPENNDSRTAHYVCTECSGKIENHQKTEMLDRGEWRATVEVAKKGTKKGFHLSSLYSPVGWYSWTQAVEDFLHAKESEQLLKVWINTTLDPNYGLASKERHRNRGLFRLHGIGNQNRKNMN